MRRHIRFQVVILLIGVMLTATSAFAGQAAAATRRQSLVTLAAEHAAKAPISVRGNGDGTHTQPTRPVAGGRRVRVIAPMLPAPLYGRVVTDFANPSAFVVETPGAHARVSIPPAGASRIDVSEGRARAKAATWGAVLGLVAGALAAKSSSGGDGATGDMATFVLAPAGALIGGGLGAMYAPERWRTMHSAVVDNPSYDVVLSAGARTKRLGDGTLAVPGERSRRAGIAYGALALGGVALVFGGRDYARGELSGSEYASAVISNTVIGAAVGYLISPRRWQKLPPLPTGR